MKRIIMIGLVMLMAITLVSASDNNVKTGQVKDLNSTTGVSAEQQYTLAVLEDQFDSYRIGFSTEAPSSVETVPTAAADSVALAFPEGADYATLADSTTPDLYIYWQIVSSTKCSVSLSATALKNGDDDIPVSFKTALDDDGNGKHGTAVTDEVTATDGDVATTIGASLYTFEPETGKVKSEYGAQKLSIKTNSVSGHATGNYSGTLTLTIKADGTN